MGPVTEERTTMAVDLYSNVWVRHWNMPGTVEAVHVHGGMYRRGIRVRLADGRTSVWHTINPQVEPATVEELVRIGQVFGESGDAYYAIIDTPDETYGHSRQELMDEIRRQFRTSRRAP
jgi:hypothetical protein